MKCKLYIVEGDFRAGGSRIADRDFADLNDFVSFAKAYKSGNYEQAWRKLLNGNTLNLKLDEWNSVQIKPLHDFNKLGTGETIISGPEDLVILRDMFVNNGESGRWAAKIIVDLCDMLAEAHGWNLTESIPALEAHKKKRADEEAARQAEVKRAADEADRKRKESKLAQERKEYERLKKKFGG